MNKTTTILGMIATAVILLSATLFAQNNTVSTTVEITETGMNRYLQVQYNALGIPNTETISFAGANYTLALTLPQVSFTPGNAKLIMVFDVNTAATNLYHFEVDPSLHIDTSQITAVQIQATLNNLPTLLNSVTSIPQWVRDGIIQYYGSLALTVFPSPLIQTINDSYISERAITVSPNFTLSISVGQGVLDLGVSTYLSSELPFFSCTINLDRPGTDNYFGVRSTIMDTVMEVLITKLDGTTVWHSYPKAVCPKNGTVWIDMGAIPISPDIYPAKILCKTSTTCYNRYFSNVNNDAAPGDTVIFLGITSGVN